MQREGAEEVRNQLPPPPEKAENGRSAIITGQQSLTPLHGSGCGL
jgi:hypothetical protein